MPRHGGGGGRHHHGGSSGRRHGGGISGAVSSGPRRHHHHHYGFHHTHHHHGGLVGHHHRHHHHGIGVGGALAAGAVGGMVGGAMASGGGGGEATNQGVQEVVIVDTTQQQNYPPPPAGGYPPTTAATTTTYTENTHLLNDDVVKDFNYDQEGVKFSTSYLLVALCLSLVVLIPVMMWFPFPYHEEVRLLVGESAIVKRDDGKFIDPTWHSSLEVFPMIPTKEGDDYARFYDDCPTKATDHRFRNYSHHFSGYSYYFDAFFLNPGSIVQLNFTTESYVYFDIYEGQWSFEHGRNPVYSTGKKTYKELAVTFTNVRYSDLYYFVYESPRVTKKVVGDVDYHLDLAVFSPASAARNCSLAGQSCYFDFERGTNQCVVIDVVSTQVDGWGEGDKGGEGGGTLRYDVRVGSRGWFYMAVFFVAPVGFFFLIAIV
eukprot:CAMPEP_0201524620 /NCGR_PEP_ID=MMETSP0161_2-20130828/23836_1 /ASSEMBLY_ACC=CAM_ASM_000251 /TAXON_ID=180227 /ORGANISM="Neoparamoeba aestuarina, Strain SoJaBio B1-5/56/2" /LENGTH=429 /DNA_ID=CAMNT_0047924111 /DNA_START=88 /DNA_END=1374 /DNA_ORIENTATION=+